MIRALQVLGALIAVSSAQAEPVRVGAGDHPGFTRIILGFDGAPVWQAQRRGSSYELKFLGDEDLRFDLSRVFRLIDRSRIADIRALDGSRIEVELACSCRVELAEAGTGALVLDIHDAAIAGTIALLAVPPGEDADEIASSDTTDPFGAGQRDAAAPPPVAELIEPSRGENAEAAHVGMAVELTARAFSRAAAQGLISVAPDVPGREQPMAFGQLRELEGRGNLSVTTSFDRVFRPETAPTPPTPTGAVCADDMHVDVATWGDVADTNLHGRLRSDAIAEDGSIDGKGAKELARYYIYLGFGAEAQIAARFMPPSPDRDMIDALAEVMDGKAQSANTLRDQAACDGAVSLWGILARPIDVKNAPGSVNAALAAFSALPSHLRTHLGPLLAERLHAAGFGEEARAAINAVTRGGVRTDESELAAARLELDGSRADDARDRLTELSTGTDQTAAKALLELLRDADAREMAPNPAWVEDAPTLVGALDGTKIAEELNIAGLKGLIALGRFDEFRVAVMEDAPGLTPMVRRELAELALATSSEVASDAALVTSEVGLSKLVDLEDLSPNLRYGLAQRLHQIGLSKRALAYLDDAPSSNAELATAIEVFLAVGEIDRALNVLKRAKGAGRDSLLARSLSAAGDERSALDAFIAAGDTDMAVSTALRLADWSWLSDNADPAIASAARALNEPLPPSDAEASNGALIVATRMRRDQVRVLLDLSKPLDAPPAFTN